MDTRQKTTLYLISSVAALAGILFGFDTGVISGAILFINKDFHLTHVQTELVISSVLLGALVGAGFSGRLCDYLGRKRIIIITALIFIVGTLISAYTPNHIFLIIGRIILGVAIGVASFAAPLYLAELAPRNKRGFLVSLNQLAITLGILLSYLIDYYYSFEQAWRMMLLFGVLPSVLLLVGMIFLPESPRFLLLKGHIDKARNILKKIRPAFEVEFEIKAVLETRNASASDLSIFTNSHMLKVLAIGIVLAMLQQVTGINTIIYYAPTIFKMAGFDTSSAILVTSFVGITNVIFTLVALPLIDKLGRRTLLFIGLIGMMLSLLSLGHAFNATEPSLSVRYITLISMTLYIACFAISLGPIVFVVLSEIFPLKIRGLAMSLAMSANWAMNMLVAMTFLSFIHAIGTSNTFYLYAFISLAGIFFVYHYIPETKNCSLELIEKNLFSGEKSKHLGKPITTHKEAKGVI